MIAPMDAKLSPCPFCGAHNPRASIDDASSWYVSCSDSNGACGAIMDNFRTKEFAVAAWNTRTPPATPSPKVDEETLQSIIHRSLIDTYGTASKWQWTVVAVNLAEKLRPYLTPQGAIRDDIAKHVYEAMQWAVAHSGGRREAPDWQENGNSDAQVIARTAANRVIASPLKREVIDPDLLAVLRLIANDD